MASPKNPTVPHSLPSGSYLIQARSDALYLAADESSPVMLPRKVITLPKGTRAPKWTIEQIDALRYYILIDNAPAAEIDEKLFAVTIWQPKTAHQIWVLQAHPQQGENVYTISTAEGHLSWVLEDGKPYTQVSVKDIGFYTPEQPPEKALFTVTRVN